jgi:hypothetical protein
MQYSKMANTTETNRSRSGLRKGQTHSGSFKKDDPRFLVVRGAIDPTTGRKVSVSELARRDTYLALDACRDILINSRSPELKMAASKCILNLGWAAAPRQTIAQITHNVGNVPSTTALMKSLTDGTPLELPSPNDPDTIDIDCDSLSRTVPTTTEGI